MTVHLVFHEDERNAYQCPFSSAYSLYHVKIHKPDRVQQFISINIVSPCWSQSTMNTIGHRATLAIEQHEHHNCHQAPRTPRTGQAVSDSTISANQVQKPWDVGHRTARTPCWPQHWPHNSTNTTLATEHYEHHEKDRQRLLRFPPTSAESWNVG